MIQHWGTGVLIAAVPLQRDPQNEARKQQAIDKDGQPENQSKILFRSFMMKKAVSEQRAGPTTSRAQPV
jgi:hypothetical protein